MSEETDFTKTLQRLMQAMNASNDAELARALGITPQSISGARKRGEVPPAWIQACAATTGVNAHCCFSAAGPCGFLKLRKANCRPCTATAWQTSYMFLWLKPDFPQVQAALK